MSFSTKTKTSPVMDGRRTAVMSVGGVAPPRSPSLDTVPRPRARVPVPFIIVASILSSVSLILINKAVMKTYEFTYVFTLTGCHFLFGWMALTFAAKHADAFTIKQLSFSQNLQVAAAGVSSIAGMNLSLRSNSVGTYQVFKLMVVPVVVVMQFLSTGTRYSSGVLLSLGVLLCGVAYATVHDVELNSVGLLFGTVSVVATAKFNIWQGSKQREHSVSPVQLLQSIAPFQAALCFLLALYFDVLGATESVFYHPFVFQEAWLILLSCIIATSVNMCSMGLIGRTSAVTYQVVGHAKTCLVLVGGFLLFPVANFDPELMAKNVLGLTVAMIGVVMYSYFKLRG